MTEKPPLGVMPDWLWWEKYTAPTPGQLLSRYQDVSAAVDRYLEAGYLPRIDWLRELGSAGQGAAGPGPAGRGMARQGLTFGG